MWWRTTRGGEWDPAPRLTGLPELGFPSRHGDTCHWPQGHGAWMRVAHPEFPYPGNMRLSLGGWAIWRVESQPLRQ